MMIDGQLDYILEVLSNLNDSVILRNLDAMP